MKAVVCTGYGPPDVLKLREVEKPIPADNEVLIKVKATTCHVGDTFCGIHHTNSFPVF